MLKIIASNTLAQLVAKFIGAGLTFLTTLIIIRLSGTIVFGDLTKALVLIAIGFTVIDFGLNALVVRQLGEADNLQGGFIDLLLTRLALSAVVVVALNLLVQVLPGGYTSEIKSVFWLGSLAIVFQGIFTSCNAVFQSQENYWRPTLSIILGAVLGATLTYYYVLSSPTLAHFLLANTLGYLLMALCSLLLLPRTQFENWRIYDLRFVFTLLRAGLPLASILLASVVASKFDTVVLGIFRSSSEVGEYGFAYRIFDVILVLPVFIMNATYPGMIRATKEKSESLIKRISLFMFISGIFAAILIYLLSPLIYLIRPGLFLSVQVLKILALTIPLFFLTSPLMWQQISQHQEKKVFRIYFLAAFINVALNFLFTPAFGVVSAAIITGVTELFILISLVYSTYIMSNNV